MKARAVIGSSFGDEGKGLLTDYFASKTNDCLVVRYNGGAQAGHTVVTPNGIRHVFSHFGAGTFTGAPTYLSKYFIVNPILFCKEAKELQFKIPKVFVHSDCLVTTPIDMAINQMSEDKRGENRHGSVGVGINETVERCENPAFRTTVADLEDPITFLQKILEYSIKQLPRRLLSLGVMEIPQRYRDVLENPNFITNWIEDIKMFRKSITKADDQVMKGRNIVFEGAQGLLLDEKSRYFPHVTRSRTGLCNIVELARIADIEHLDVTYVSRCYRTRHGAGHFPYEIKEKPYKNVIDITNKTHEYQGDLRFGWLDLIELAGSIDNDLKDSIGLSVKPSLAITCLDQINDGNIRYVLNGEEKAPINHFLDITKDITGIDVSHISFGPCRDCVKEV